MRIWPRWQSVALRFGLRGSDGQGLVEFALIVPVLLILALGFTDATRAFHYSITLNDAARNGAAFAARSTAVISTADVTPRVCRATGLVADSPTPSCPGLTVTYTSPSTTNLWHRVSASYSMPLLSSYVFGRDAFVITAQADFPVLQ